MQHEFCLLPSFIFFLLALICEIIGTIGGFGSSVFFVPMAGWFFDFKTVLGITGMMHVFSNSSKLILFRKHILWNLFFRIGIPSIVLVIAGGWLSSTYKLIMLICIWVFFLSL